MLNKNESCSFKNANTFQQTMETKRSEFLRVARSLQKNLLTALVRSDSPAQPTRAPARAAESSAVVPGSIKLR